MAHVNDVDRRSRDDTLGTWFCLPPSREVTPLVSDIESSDVPWTEAVVLVCTKCSRKIAGDESLADALKKTLKLAFKDAGFGKNVRSVTSSCLDICPKDRVAIAVAKRRADTRAITVDPKIDDVALFTEVKKLALP